MKMPCRRCGGSKKQHRYNSLGYPTKELVVCAICKGKGWQEIDMPGPTDGRERIYGRVLPTTRDEND